MKGFIEVHDADQHWETVLMSVDSIVTVTKSSNGGTWINRRSGSSIHAWEEMDKIKRLIEEATK